jgi:FkbM family methyltransferase
VRLGEFEFDGYEIVVIKRIKMELRRAHVRLTRSSWFKTMVFSSRLMNGVYFKVLPKSLLMLLVRGFETPLQLRVFPAGCNFLLSMNKDVDHFVDAMFDELRTWEKRPIATWKEFANDAGVVLDVGSYVGVYSIVAQQAGAKRVIAIEPNPAAAQLALENFQLNGLKNIELVEVALGEHPGPHILSMPPGKTLSSGSQILRGAREQTNLLWSNSLEVEVWRLDDLVNSLGLDRVDAIKIDAEGFELEVLKGGTQTLALHRPKLIIELLSEEALRHVSEFLSLLGYSTPSPLDGTNHSTLSGKQWNARKEKPATNYRVDPSGPTENRVGRNA